MPICKLCLEEKTLIKKSHIIPDFMYKSLYDEKHFLNKLIPKLLKKGKKMPRIPTGEYESGILCQDCESQKLGKFETYGSIALYGGYAPKNQSPIVNNFVNQDGIKFSKTSNIDYAKFKLFLLSILWRSHVSSREFFKEIDLGEDAETIRRMIDDENPGDELDYPMWFLTYAADKSAPSDVISQPTIQTFEGCKIAIFIIHGMIYCFLLSKDSIPDIFRESTIKKTNEMIMFHLPEGRSFEFLLRYHGILKT